MVKFAGFLKRAKKLGDVIAKGASWVNKNIVKPILPAAKTVLEATGFGSVGNVIEKGSNLLENVLEKQGYKAKDDIGKYVKFGSEYLVHQAMPGSGTFGSVDTQRPIVANRGKFKKLF